MTKLWNRLFLEERPSISFAFFRIAVAIAVGCYVLPTFFPLSENYLQTAFKNYNTTFFSIWFLDVVQKSPDILVSFAVGIFCAAWFFFLIGFLSQISCIVMTLGCYYFYALNYFAVGTLTWDILLVTLFQMCVTSYHGDYFSVDCLLRKDPDAYKRRRPYFIQRCLQMQIASTYFYTGLHKITGSGNWLTENPLYYLMNYPPTGVVKNFMLKEFLAVHPGVCYVCGIIIVGIELLMPFLLFYPPTRISAIFWGIVFHIMLILTLDVPSIFFFMFPAQLLLFIHPDLVLHWIEKKRHLNKLVRPNQLIFDGNCHFCRATVRRMEVMDLFATLNMVNYQDCENIQRFHPQLTRERAHSQLHLLEIDGKLYGGFDVFRRLCFNLPMLYPLIPILYFPGSGVWGPWIYRWVANNRYLFHSRTTCRANACFR